MRRKTHTRWIIRLIVQGFCFLFLLGCLSQIQIDTEPTSGQVVVSGQVSTISDQSRIELGRTAGTSRLPFPVVGATVWLHDDLGNDYLWTESTERPGRFTLPDVQAVPGRTYHVRVILAEGGTYLSREEKMPEGNASGEVTHSFEYSEYIDREGVVTTQPFINLYTNATFPPTGEPLFVRWSVQEVYVLRPTDFPDPFGSVPPPCYVTQAADPQRIVLASSDALNGSATGTLLLCSRLVDRSFYDKHYFITYQSSLTVQAYEYWEKIDIVVNQVGSIFDTPPAAVKGNIYNPDNADENVLGYFQAANQTSSRFFLVAADITVPITFRDCTYFPSRDFNSYAGECLDCLSLRNSSYRRPDWF